jgi:hypothetical protein
MTPETPETRAGICPGTRGSNGGNATLGAGGFPGRRRGRGAPIARRPSLPALLRVCSRCQTHARPG